nr:MAG TPA: hypothetical protein [Caudoviricetes sp.]
MRIDHIAHAASSPRVRAVVLRLSSALLKISAAGTWSSLAIANRSTTVRAVLPLSFWETVCLV